MQPFSRPKVYEPPILPHDIKTISVNPAHFPEKAGTTHELSEEGFLDPNDLDRALVEGVKGRLGMWGIRHWAHVL